MTLRLRSRWPPGFPTLPAGTEGPLQPVAVDRRDRHVGRQSDQDDLGRHRELQRLRGVYVRKVEGGYVPTAGATALYRAVLAHRPTDPTEPDPGTVDTPCPVCGSSLTLAYERGFVSLECGSCGEWPGITYPFPRNGFEGRDGEDVLGALHDRIRHHLELARRNQCPACAGSTTADLRLSDAGSDDHYVELACDTCSFAAGTGPLPAVRGDDRVGAALRETGVDAATYDWRLPEATARVESRDPPLLEIAVETGEGSVTIVVDGELSVREVRSTA